jgi:hypothetical protein
METNDKLTLDQAITVMEILSDHIADLRHKLRIETKSDLIAIRLGVLTHYRNIKIYILQSIDKGTISNREIIGIIFKN